MNQVLKMEGYQMRGCNCPGIYHHPECEAGQSGQHRKVDVRVEDLEEALRFAEKDVRFKDFPANLRLRKAIERTSLAAKGLEECRGK